MTEIDNNLLDAVLKVGGDPADLAFWQGCAEGRFLVHRCEICNRNYWPASRCVDHGDRAMKWVTASGDATLHTYTVMHRSYIPAMKDRVPYIIGVVELAEGPFYHTNIIGCERDALEVGMALRVTMEPHQSGLVLPMFAPLT